MGTRAENKKKLEESISRFATRTPLMPNSPFQFERPSDEEPAVPSWTEGFGITEDPSESVAIKAMADKYGMTVKEYKRYQEILADPSIITKYDDEIIRKHNDYAIENNDEARVQNEMKKAEHEAQLEANVREREMQEENAQYVRGPSSFSIEDKRIDIESYDGLFLEDGTPAYKEDLGTGVWGFADGKMRPLDAVADSQNEEMMKKGRNYITQSGTRPFSQYRPEDKAGLSPEAQQLSKDPADGYSLGLYIPNTGTVIEGESQESKAHKTRWSPMIESEDSDVLSIDPVLPNNYLSIGPALTANTVIEREGDMRRVRQEEIIDPDNPEYADILNVMGVADRVTPDPTIKPLPPGKKRIEKEEDETDPDKLYAAATLFGALANGMDRWNMEAFNIPIPKYDPQRYKSPALEQAVQNQYRG